MENFAYEAEEIWLRSFLSNQDEICFEIEAQRTMVFYRVNMSEVLFVLQNGSVIYSERTELGSMIKVIGINCDEEEIEVSAHMVSEMMHVSVIKVRKLKRLEK